MEAYRMDEIIRELQETRVAMQRLNDDYQAEKQLSENLKIVKIENLHKLHEAKTEIEKLKIELISAKEEASLAKQMVEDLKSNLYEKESLLKHLNCRQDEDRISFAEKVQELLMEKIELVSALDEASLKLADNDRELRAIKDEVEALKELLAISQENCLKAEEKAKAHQEIRQRDDLLFKCEMENRKLEDQFKWKNENFQHLEQAHEDLQDQFQASKKEWEMERVTLLDEICSLQTKLESTTNLLGSIQSELQKCNLALAHEEKRRKLLELQLTESKNSYETMCTEFEEAKSTMEVLNDTREKEIATLRNLMATKEALLKGMEYASRRLEQDNQELKGSLKELQEAQISQAGSAASVSKLRQKLRGLEKAQKNCSMVLKAKEAEWNCQTEALTKDLDETISELNTKNEQIKQLMTKLDNVHFSLEPTKKKNEEMPLLLVSSGSGCAVSHIEVGCLETELKLDIEKKAERIAFLTEQLDQKNKFLLKALEDVKQEEEKAQHLEHQVFLMQRELQTCKEMLSQSFILQQKMKEKASEKECALTFDLRTALEALDNANSEFMEIKSELNKKSRTVDNLQEDIVSLELECLMREIVASIFSATIAEQSFLEEKQSFIKMGEEKDERVRRLQKLVLQLEQENLLETNRVNIFWEKIATTTVLFEFDIQMRERLVAEMEKDISNLKQRLLCSENFEFKLKTEGLKAVSAINQLNHNLRTHDTVIEKLKAKNGQLIQQLTRSTIEKNKVINEMREISDKIGESLSDDVILRSLELVLGRGDSDFPKENDCGPCNSGKNINGAKNADGRSPLKDING